MLKDTPFYILVDNKEKRQVYIIMAWEFTNIGYWNIYLNGHSFIVGEIRYTDADVGIPTVRRSRRGAKAINQRPEW